MQKADRMKFIEDIMYLFDELNDAKNVDGDSIVVISNEIERLVIQYEQKLLNNGSKNS